MVDINQRAKTPGQAAGIIKVAGIDGTNLPDVSQSIQLPETPSVPNVSGELFAEATQTINQSIESQSQLIATRSRNAAAAAQAQANSPNRSGLAEVIGGLSAGLELFGQMQQARQQQQVEVGTAQFERRIRDQVVQMNTLIADNSHDFGFIPTQRQAFQEIDRQFGHLPLSVRQEVFSIAQTALNDAQKQQTARRINQVGEMADTIREQRRQQLLTIATARLERLRLVEDPDVINSTIDQIIGDTDGYLSSIGVSGIDAINLSTTIYELINASLTDNFKHTGETQRRVNTFNTLAQRAIEITQNTQGDPRRQQLLLAQLDVEAGGQLPGVNFRNLIPSNSDVVSGFLQEQESLRALNEYRNRNVWQTTDVTEATNFKTGSLIFGVHNNDPRAVFIRERVDRGEEQDPTIITAVRLAEEFDTDLTSFRDLSRQYLDYEVQINEAEVLIEEVARKLDPTGTLGPVTVTGPFVERLVQLAGRERGRITPEEADKLFELHNRRIGTFQQNQVDTRSQLDQLIRRWQPYGLRLDNPTSNESLLQLESRARPLIEQAEQEFRRRQSEIPPGLGGTPNFSTGPMATTPPIAPLHTTTAGLTLPFLQSRDEQDVVITSEYGVRRNPVTGRSQFHSGADFDTVNGDENIRAVAGGEVLHVGEWSGFGGTITIRTDSGHVEQYSHLRRLDVSPGDRIPPGTIIGLMGGDPEDPMSGNSTGAHLHFTVYGPDTPPDRIGRPPYDGTTIDPIGYLSSIQHSTQLTRGAGLAPNQSHPGSDQVSFGNTWLDENFNLYRRSRHVGGGSVFSGDLTVAAAPTQVFNNSNPQPTRRASIQSASYPTSNDPTANYGYGVLRDDPALARALAQTSNNLGIPAQWLADVMAHESGFRAHVTNGAGAVGLIQFYPGGGLATVANHMGVSESAAADRLRSMSGAEQMQFVELFLRPYADKINTVEDLLAAVFGGPRLLNMTPANRREVDDNFITFGEYVQRLGSQVGRRYQTSYDRRRAAAPSVHTNFTASCPTCNQMLSNLGFVVPHNG